MKGFFIWTKHKKGFFLLDIYFKLNWFGVVSWLVWETPSERENCSETLQLWDARGCSEGLQPCLQMFLITALMIQSSQTTGLVTIHTDTHTHVHVSSHPHTNHQSQRSSLTLKEEMAHPKAKTHILVVLTKMKIAKTNVIGFLNMERMLPCV